MEDKKILVKNFCSLEVNTVTIGHKATAGPMKGYWYIYLFGDWHWEEDKNVEVLEDE